MQQRQTTNRAPEILVVPEVNPRIATKIPIFVLVKPEATPTPKIPCGTSKNIVILAAARTLKAKIKTFICSIANTIAEEIGFDSILQQHQLYLLLAVNIAPNNASNCFIKGNGKSHLAHCFVEFFRCFFHFHLFFC